MAPTIQASDLVKVYGELTALGGVSFEVSQGEIFGYLGRNGSGKTTTVRILTTLTRQTSGSATVAGLDVTTDAAGIKHRIGVTMQEAALDPQMTGSEHLKFIAGILGHRARKATARSSEMLELFGLSDVGGRPIGTYSGGMKRRLDIATALLGEPEILFLDEPTTGLDPQSRRALWEEIRRLKSRGVTVFLTTQYLEEADQLADHLAIVDKGFVIAAGTPRLLKAEHGRKRISFRHTTGSEGIADRLDLNTSYVVTSEAGRIGIEVPADISEQNLLETLGRVSAANQGLVALEVTDTTLEDVFLRLTGSDINEVAVADAVPT